MENENIVIIIFGIVLISALAGSMVYYYSNPPIFEENNTGNVSEDEQLIGGCAGVYYEYWGECCERVALENNIVKPACVGNWTVEDNVCKWECSTN